MYPFLQRVDQSWWYAKCKDTLCSLKIICEIWEKAQFCSEYQNAYEWILLSLQNAYKWALLSLQKLLVSVNCFQSCPMVVSAKIVRHSWYRFFIVMIFCYWQISFYLRKGSKPLKQKESYGTMWECINRYRELQFQWN